MGNNLEITLVYDDEITGLDMHLFSECQTFSISIQFRVRYFLDCIYLIINYHGNITYTKGCK